MVKPVYPSPLRNVVTARQTQDPLDAINQSIDKTNTPIDTVHSLVDAGDGLTQTSSYPSTPLAAEIDAFTSKVLAANSETPQSPQVSRNTYPSPLHASTTTRADGSSIDDSPFNAPYEGPSSVLIDHSRSSQPLTSPARLADLSLDLDKNEGVVHNKGRDGPMVLPVNQSVLRQANLSLRDGIANTDRATQDRRQRRRSRAYQESFETAEPSFREGTKGYMVNGCGVAGDQEGQNHKGLLEGDADFEEMTAIKHRVTEQAAIRKKDVEENEKNQKDDADPWSEYE